MFFRSRFKRVFLGLLGIGALLGAVGCHHYRKNMSAEERSQFISSRVADKLDLTDAQKSDLRAILKDVFETHQKMKADRAENLSRLKENVKSDELDTAQILEVYRAKRDTIDNFVPTLVEKLRDFHKTLDAKQKQQLVGFLEKAERLHD